MTSSQTKYQYEQRPKLFNDLHETATSIEQQDSEENINKYLKVYRLAAQHNFSTIKLQRDFHVFYLRNGLRGLPQQFDSLDASRPWLVYWIVHGLDMLDGFSEISQQQIDGIVDFLGNQCQNRVTGGFGGGPGQLPHLAPTYASINSLTIINPLTSVKNSAFDVVDRDKLYQFLLSLKDEKSGGFRMHKDGEVDIRGTYCALSVATLLNICTEELMKGVRAYIVDSQTYEGGIGSFPGFEGHGGYAFCGLAALSLLKDWEGFNIDQSLHWCVRRQMSFEGGFQGRTNKLVDSCYSFWMGSTIPLMQGILAAEKPEQERTELDLNVFKYLQWEAPAKNNNASSDSINSTTPLQTTTETTSVSIEDMDAQVEDNIYPELEDTEWMMNQTALQEYLLLCAQLSNGGMRDKPGKSRDYYHSCYALSGLSIAQNNPSGKITTLGLPANTLRVINPIFGVCADKVALALKHFGNRDLI